MAHFAELDDNNKVLRVVVIANEDIVDKNGVEKEELGQAFCHGLYGGRWVQTSYNNNFRKRYASPNYYYDETLDAFITPKPFSSWTLNEETIEWEAPIPYPDDGIMYQWNEELSNWEAMIFEVPD